MYWQHAKKGANGERREIIPKQARPLAHGPFPNPGDYFPRLVPLAHSPAVDDLIGQLSSKTKRHTSLIHVRNDIPRLPPNQHMHVTCRLRHHSINRNNHHQARSQAAEKLLCHMVCNVIIENEKANGDFIVLSRSHCAEYLRYDAGNLRGKSRHYLKKMMGVNASSSC